MPFIHANKPSVVVFFFFFLPGTTFIYDNDVNVRLRTIGVQVQKETDEFLDWSK